MASVSQLRCVSERLIASSINARISGWRWQGSELRGVDARAQTCRSYSRVCQVDLYRCGGLSRMSLPATLIGSMSPSRPTTIAM